MPDRLYFTDSDEANALIASDPMALLIGFAWTSRCRSRRPSWGRSSSRSGSALDAETLAGADLEPAFRQKPAIHRFPGSMAQRVHDLSIHVLEHYDGDARRVWTEAQDAAALRANLSALPGFGEMKVKALGAVLANRFGVAAARELVHPIRPSATSTPARRWRTTRPPSGRTRPSG